MTSVSLSLWIAAGIALQLILWLGISFRRHWLDYRSLQEGREDGSDHATTTSQRTPAEAIEPAGTPAWNGFRPFRVARREFEDEARTVCSFYLVPEDGMPLPAFLPGQFLTFRLTRPGGGGEGEALVRCYSLSDKPDPAHYRVSIKRVPAPDGGTLPPGRSSSHFHDHVQVGDLLQVRAPGGHFHIDPGSDPVVLIAGGIGITPMLSMLNWCVAEQPGREIRLYYGVRDGRELVQSAHLEALAAAHANVHLRLCFSAPRPEDLQHPGSYHGRVDVGLLRRELPLKPFHFHVCGPAALLESVVTGLDEWGVPSNRIHYEAFGPSTFRRPVSDVPEPVVAGTSGDIPVTFARSGKTVAWRPGSGSLLDLAEANGVRMDSGCRSGSCGSCQTTIKAGEIRYLNLPDYDPEPGACLPCSCVPKTRLTLEA